MALLGWLHFPIGKDEPRWLTYITTPVTLIVIPIAISGFGMPIANVYYTYEQGKYSILNIVEVVKKEDERSILVDLGLIIAPGGGTRTESHRKRKRHRYYYLFWKDGKNQMQRFSVSEQLYRKVSVGYQLRFRYKFSKLGYYVAESDIEIIH